MENHIKNNPLENLGKKEYTILINSLEKVRFGIFMGLLFYIGMSELIMDKLLNLKEWELLVRSSYLILFSYLWIKYGQRKKRVISVVAMDNGLYFLISKTSKLYPSLYFFVNWEEIEHISLNLHHDEQLSHIKTKIPLVKTTAPLINTKLPLLKGIYLRYLPENYEKISLHRASFSQPEIFSKTVIIELDIIEIKPDIMGTNKWITLNQKYPVKIIQ